jgi:trehalose/maltose hydrolase-like predicted phosphorylase
MIVFRDRRIKIKIEKEKLIFTLEAGERLNITVYDHDYDLTSSEKLVIEK